MPPLNFLWTTGALMGASSILTGAFGAHGLKAKKIPLEKVRNWNTAAHYQMIHSVMILISAKFGNESTGWLFAAGNLLFSGSIYALVLGGQTLGKKIGIFTPIGGLFYVAAWLSLAIDGGH